MNKPLVLMLAGVGVGFMAGFLWGQAARADAQQNVKTSMNGGVVTIEVDAGGAMVRGLQDLLN